MSAPNIVGVTTIASKSSGAVLATSSADILVNAANSGKVLKVNLITAANVHATNNIDVTLAFYDASVGVSYRIAGAITVPFKSTLTILDKSLYLEEGDKITGLTNSANSAEVIVSYEEMG